MRCFFKRQGRIVGVVVLPDSSDDEEKISRSKQTFSQQPPGRYDGFEVWDHARFIYRFDVETAAVQKSSST